MSEHEEDGLTVWPAAERNKQPILEALLSLVTPGHGTILEVAAGTGQHAVHIAPHFPGYDYYVSDCDEEHLQTLARRLRVARIASLMGPLRIDTTELDWKLDQVDIIYNANMVHIAPLSAARGLFRGAGRLLRQDGLLITYGPYRVDGRHTSESNERFHESLRERNEQWGVRDVGELEELASDHALSLVERRSMPANNLILVWKKLALRV